MSQASPNDENLLRELVRTLSDVPGIRAIVLGGSRARGEATAQSDYDIGLYYEPEAPIDVGRLAKVAGSSVTAIGDWGPWINGGAWLTVDGRRVDLLYRDLGKARDVIEACCAGRVERVYQPGHPHAFVSSIYMGEVALCRPLWDPEGALASLRRRCSPYPPALAEALIRTFLWEARFAIENALHGRGKDDPAYVAGCAFRAVACLCQSLFALNGVYLLNEKGATQAVERLPRRPAGFATRVAQAFGAGATGLSMLSAVVDETTSLSSSSPPSGGFKQ
ncbi:MAG: nucleotidyltransferase domain-containing protein [Alphaproteobacteria bacterium]|nr:nucleotidyltransferase domain-containing protein [Alphaproteobacteria bacterium]